MRHAPRKRARRPEEAPIEEREEVDATDIYAGQVGVDKLAGCWKEEYKLALRHNLATCIILDGERKSERKLEKKPRIRLGERRIEV